MGVSYNPKIVTNGLLLALDPGNTKSYSGSGTTWRDLSGRNNNFTLNGSPIYSATDGGYFLFNGITNDAVLSSWSWPSTTSICFFVYPITLSTAYSRIVSTGTSDGFEIGLSTTNRLSYYTPTNGWVDVGGAGIATLDSNQWNFIALSQFQTTITTYKNGVSTYTSNFTSTAGSSLHLGRRHNASEGANIRLSNLQIYNRTLTAEEIQQNYNTLRGRYGI